MIRRLLIGSTAAIALIAVSSQAALTVATNFWNIGWGHGEAEYIATAYQHKWSTAPNGNPWSPQFLSDLQIYSCIRFMDWNEANSNTPNNQFPWSSRKAKTSTSQGPVAYEWQIDLCNRVNADYWVNLPVECPQDPNYAVNLATLIKNNLNANLKVYVEYANEVWWEPASNPYCASHASSVGLSSYDQYYVYASVQIWTAFESVFGQNSPRLVKILAGQGGNNGLITTHLNNLKNTKINPNGVKMTAYAVANYIDPGQWNSMVNVASGAYKVLGTTYPLVFYEGGYNGMRPGATAYTDYKNMLAGMNQYVNGPYCHYTHVDYDGSWYWGAKGLTSDANTQAASPKYYALWEWAQTHPKPQTQVAPRQAPASSARPGLTNVSPANAALYGIDGRRLTALSVRQARGCIVAVPLQSASGIVVRTR